MDRMESRRVARAAAEACGGRRCTVKARVSLGRTRVGMPWKGPVKC